MKISVVITCHNYGEYLDQCVLSVVRQRDVEPSIIIVDDASTDVDTKNALSRLEKDRRILVLRNDERCGLAASANRGIAASTGDLIMRLDADDWLDVDCLSIMHNRLKQRPHYAAAFSDYWLFDAEKPERKYTVQDDDEIPLGSCVLMHRKVWSKLEGYDESLAYQEDYDFNRRLLDEYAAATIHLPLWWYRKHKSQMSNNHNERMKVRQSINHGAKILTVIPARAGSKGVQNKNLREIAGVSLVARAIRMVKDSGVNTLLAVSTDSSDIANITRREGVEVISRPAALARDEVSTIPVAKHAMESMDELGWHADIVISVQPTCPYTPPSALRKAVDLLEEKGLDSVVSVAEITGTHPYRAYKFDPDNNELEPYYREPAQRYLQRQDRPKAHGFTGGFYARRRFLLDDWNGSDFAIGNCHGVEVPQEAAIDIDTEMDLWLAETIVNRWGGE